jgi:hypothetical protein
MTTAAPEKTTDVVTASQTIADQQSANTRRFLVDTSGEIETHEIRRNAEFHATLVERLATSGPTVDATDLFPDL